MLIYNTTFHVEEADARNFVIWINEVYIPQVEASGRLSAPRLSRILSHPDPDSECFALQWEVKDSATLHAWHTEQGLVLNQEMLSLFQNKIVAIPTLMEVIR